MHMREALTLVLAVGVLTLLCPAVQVQMRGGPQRSVLTAPWEVEVTPFYLWLPATEGHATILGRSFSTGTAMGVYTEYV